MKSATGSEWVFVYGTLREGSSNAARMKGGEFFGEGWIQGQLYAISWYPGLTLRDSHGRVKGELFRVTPEHLRLLDDYEGIAAGEMEGGEYRRVRATVTLDHPSRQEVEAWVWEWKGPVDESRRIVSGDWRDFERPPGKPLFTLLGVLPFGALIGSFTIPGSIEGPAGVWLVPTLLMAPIFGFAVIWMALRRREPLSGLRSFQHATFVVWLIADVMAVAIVAGLGIMLGIAILVAIGIVYLLLDFLLRRLG